LARQSEQRRDMLLTGKPPGSTSSPRLASTRQTLTTPSAPPDARYRPWRLKATAQMTPLCAASSCAVERSRACQSSCAVAPLLSGSLDAAKLLASVNLRGCT